MVAALLVLPLLGFTVSPLLPQQLRAPSTPCRSARMKATPDETPEERPEININKNSVVEFHSDNKARPILGLVQGAEYKAKGGARIQIIDASGKTHAVKEAAIHINVGAYKGKLVEPADILKEYEAVMQTDAEDLGIDVMDLEMAWELCEEDEHANFSPKAILSLVDDKFFKSSLDAYKAFRLLTSDMGKVFFKAVNANAYKAKPAKSVQASKINFCNDHDSLEWCFV